MEIPIEIDGVRGRYRRLRRMLGRTPYLLPLVLLIVAVIANRALQPNLFEARVLNGNFRVWLPLMLVAVGQALVVLGGGLDLSVGAIVSMGNAILVTQITPESSAGHVLLIVGVVLLVGIVAGLINGFATSYLGLQAIITTYATSFIFAGVALFVLPQPGGSIPREMTRFYRNTTPLNLPLAFYLIGGVLLIWAIARARRYGRFLYAVGGQADAAYTTGIPVTWIRMSTYVLSGVMSMLAAMTLTLNTGAGDPRIGNAMTLDSIVAVVIGGNLLSGGIGGVAGPVMGVAILGFIRNIISFANVNTWWRTLVDATIIVVALAGPGLIRLVRGRLQRYAED